MAINGIINSINKAQTNIANLASKATYRLGSSIEGIKNTKIKDGFYKTMNKIEPTGANNSFFVLLALMLGFVIAPRVITALNRNPDDKEATKDEIDEIINRDSKTVAVILFALKSMNAVIASAASKITGLPMTNKPYKPLFENKEKGLSGISAKAKEFVTHPADKLKTIGRNILDTLNPIGGVAALNNDQIQANYSNYSSVDEILKKLKDIKENGGGDDKKVFSSIVDNLISELKGNLSEYEKKSLASASQDGTIADTYKELIKNTKERLQELEALKAQGPQALKNAGTTVQQLFVSFFKNPNNALVMKAKGLNAYLRAAALAIEIGYLGFGLPALYQRHLEKKYLTNKNNPNPFSSERYDKASATMLDRSIKANEIQLFHNFIK